MRRLLLLPALILAGCAPAADPAPTPVFLNTWGDAVFAVTASATYYAVRCVTDPDIPPNEGWQYWVDSLTGTSLHEGTNTIRIRRDPDADDAFAIGTVRIHWKEAIESEADTAADTAEASPETAPTDDGEVVETNTAMFDDADDE